MNKELSVVTSKILMNKLGVVANRLQQLADPYGTNPDYNTLEKVVTEATKILSDFYTRLSDPQYKPVKLISDTVPDPDDYNSNFQGISDDLEVVFAEFENLESVVLGNFNYMVSRLNRLNGKLTSVYSRLGDYLLYASVPTKDVFFLQDSFNNLDRVDFNTPLLSQEQCEVNMDEGVVTLPIDHAKEVTLKITNSPVVNSNSNGTPGNNQQAGASVNDDMSMMLDGNADTWFEYERVVTQDDGVALIFDFTLNLGTPKVINNIRINPNNFGTRTQVEILNIDTSLEGEKFVSIKDDVPIADFLYEDEANVFTLAPSTSKYAGQGLYTFSPRMAKFIRLSFKQSTSYIITNSDGREKFRYAIGIRDVEIKALPYLKIGEMVSTEMATLDDVRKVGILSNQNPDSATTSLLASIDHFVSPDNGISWYQLRPLVSTGVSNNLQSIPEVLDFNGIDSSSIKTTNPILSLRYKAVLTRNSDAFVSDSPELAQTIADFTEMHQAPVTTPFEITLQHRPIDGTLSLADPLMGSRGKETTRHYIAKGNGEDLTLKLPFAPLQRTLVKQYIESGPNSGQWISTLTDPQTIYVNGVAWTRGDPTSANTYKLNFDDGTLTFSGTKVPNNAVVSMTLEEERLFPGANGKHVANFKYPTALDQDRVSIVYRDESTAANKTLDKGVQVHSLQPNMDETIKLQFTESSKDVLGSGMFERQIDFIDGNTEFIASSGCYSIDFTNGMLYSSRPTGLTNDIHVAYNYYPETALSNTDWNFESTTGGNAVISLSSFRSTVANTYTVPQGIIKVSLPHSCIVQGTLKLTCRDGTTRKEVPFRDGRSELNSFQKTSDILKLTVIPAVDPWEETHNFWTITTTVREEPVRTLKGPFGGWNTQIIRIPVPVLTPDISGWFQNYAFATTKLKPVDPLVYPDVPITFSKPEIFRRLRGNIFDGTEHTVAGDYSIYIYPWDEEGTCKIWVKLGTSAITGINYGIFNPLHSLTVNEPDAITQAQVNNPGAVLYSFDTYHGKYNDKYSVNYETGEIFFASSLTAMMDINYEYTNYYAKYDIQRHVEELNWTYDSNKNVIQINDREILHSMEVPQTSPESVAQKYYRVSYRYVKEARQDVAELEPYFSPVLKNYALKIVTKSRLT